MTEDQKFVEFCRQGLQNNEPIRLSQSASRKLIDAIDNPSPPSPALLLALEKGRRIRSGMAK